MLFGLRATSGLSAPISNLNAGLTGQVHEASATCRPYTCLPTPYALDRQTARPLDPVAIHCSLDYVAPARALAVTSYILNPPPLAISH